MLNLKYLLNISIIITIILIININDKINCVKKKSTNKKKLTNPDNDEQCSENVKDKIDVNVAKLLTIGPNGRRWPENEQEHDVYCAETKKLNQQLENYKQTCATGSSKEFASIIIYSIRKVTRQYCRKSSSNKRKYDKLFLLYSCSNILANQTGNCLETYIDSLLSTIKLSTIKEKIPYTCCNYFEFLKCTDDSFHSNSKCSSSTEMFQEFVRTIFDDIINVACGDYQEFSDKCEKLPKLTIDNNSNRTKKRPKSIIVPLIEIWDESNELKN